METMLAQTNMLFYASKCFCSNDEAGCMYVCKSIHTSVRNIYFQSGRTGSSACLKHDTGILCWVCFPYLESTLRGKELFETNCRNKTPANGLFSYNAISASIFYRWPVQNLRSTNMSTGKQAHWSGRNVRWCISSNKSLFPCQTLDRVSAFALL